MELRVDGIRWDTYSYRQNRATVLYGATHCALCGGELTTHPHPHPHSSTADHITPKVVAAALGWSLDQINSTANLQPAHLRCNIRRQERAAVDATTPPPSRLW